MESNSADSSESSNKSEKESGIVGASFNIINAILGSGIIGIPAAIREAGFSMGVVLLVLVGMVTEYTLYILVSTGVSVGCFSYQEVMRRAFGRSGYILATVVQFAAAFSGESHKSIAFCSVCIPLPLLNFLLSPSILKLKLPLSLLPSSNGVLYYYSGRHNHANNWWNT